jgi:hypothetical protein
VLSRSQNILSVASGYLWRMAGHISRIIDNPLFGKLE